MAEVRIALRAENLRAAHEERAVFLLAHGVLGADCEESLGTVETFARELGLDVKGVIESPVTTPYPSISVAPGSTMFPGGGWGGGVFSSTDRMYLPRITTEGREG